jgi:hypothetical protein
MAVRHLVSDLRFVNLIRRDRRLYVPDYAGFAVCERVYIRRVSDAIDQRAPHAREQERSRCMWASLRR